MAILSWMVVRRRSEIGVRMALGATRRGIVGLMLREALALVGDWIRGRDSAGAAGGGAVAADAVWIDSRRISRVLLLAMVGMAIVSLLASWLPADSGQPAVDPMKTLREE